MSRMVSLLDGVAFTDDGMDKHIEFMNTLLNQADQVQMTQTDAQKSFYLIRSIERGNAPWFDGKSHTFIHAHARKFMSIS